MKTITERDRLMAEANAILGKSNFTKEDRSKYDALLMMVDKMDGGSMELRRARMAQLDILDGKRSEYSRSTDLAYRNFVTALRSGHEVLPFEERDLSVGTNVAGGYTAPAQFSDSLAQNMAAFDRLFDPNVTDVLETATGGPMQWPVIDDSTATATVIAENGPFNESGDAVFADPLYLQKATTWRTDLLKVSRELVEDGRFPIDGILSKSFAIRLARGIGTSFMATLLGQIAVGKAAASGQTTTVIFEDLEDLVGSVDEFYRSSPKCGWMMRQNTATAISKLKDSSGRPLKLIEYGLNRVPYLLGFPVWVSPSVPALGTSGSPVAGNKAILFGDFNAVKVRRVADSLSVKRIFERFAEFGQVAYTSMARANVALAIVSGADSPIKYFANAAS